MKLGEMVSKKGFTKHLFCVMIYTTNICSGLASSSCADGYVGRQNSDPNNPSPPAAELPLHKGAFGTPRRRPLQGKMEFVRGGYVGGVIRKPPTHG